MSPFEKEMNERIGEAMKKWEKEKGFTKAGVSTREIAEEVGFTVEQIAYYFKTSMNVSLSAWRKRLRIEYAMELLLTRPELSMSEIGRLCGICDRSDFRRQFIEITGKTPLKWQKENL